MYGATTGTQRELPMNCDLYLELGEQMLIRRNFELLPALLPNVGDRLIGRYLFGDWDNDIGAVVSQRSFAYDLADTVRCELGLVSEGKPANERMIQSLLKHGWEFV